MSQTPAQRRNWNIARIRGVFSNLRSLRRQLGISADDLAGRD